MPRPVSGTHRQGFRAPQVVFDVGCFIQCAYMFPIVDRSCFFVFVLFLFEDSTIFSPLFFTTSLLLTRSCFTYISYENFLLLSRSALINPNHASSGGRNFRRRRGRRLATCPHGPRTDSIVLQTIDQSSCICILPLISAHAVVLLEHSGARTGC